MTTYDVLVSDSIVDEFLADGPRRSEGFRVLGPAEGPAAYRAKRFRVEDDNAPEWTQGKLIDPVFTAHYNDEGEVDRVTVTGWTEVDEEALRIGTAMQQVEDNPGRRYEA